MADGGWSSPHRHSSTPSRASDRTSPPRDTPPQRHTTSRGMGLFSSLMSSLRRSQPRHESPPPAPEDLGLKTLRQLYSQYREIGNPIAKEKQLYKIVPLFCKNCSKYSGYELESKFPEAFDFAEGVSLLFVRHVTQLAQGSNTMRSGVSLLKYFESSEDPETGSTSGTGFTILTAINILANGSEALVSSMTSSNLCSILVRCLDLFRSLPSTSDSRSRSGSLSRTSTSSNAGTVDEQLTDSPSPELAQRLILEKLFHSVLNRLLRNPSAVEDLVKCSDISLLFGAVSSPCAPHNKMWRKAAADCLITICRHSLSDDVISYIHKNGCIMFSIKNIERCIEQQPSLEVVEMFSTLFCCLKDSADFSQVLLEDFSSGRGYKLLYDYLMRLDRTDSEESRAAIKNLVLLLQDLVFAGFLSLEPTISDGGPFQDRTFSVPVPSGDGTSVRNNDVFQILQDAFLNSHASTLGLAILDALDYIFRTDPANYFIVQENHTVSSFLEELVEKNDDVQAQVFVLLEYVMMELNYIPTAELTSIGLLLTKDEYPKTLTLALNFLLKLISHDAKFKTVFLDVGILTMLLNALKVYASKLRQLEETADSVETPSSLSSPSLPLGDLHGAEEEYTFLLMECIRATIEGSVQNGQVFRVNGGTSCVLQMINYHKPRRMALRLLTQLILLEDGSVDLNALLDQLNQSSQTAVAVKSEVLQTVLGVFQLDSSKKSVFREVSGFFYLISVLASLIGSLSPRRASPWIKVPRTDILKLVQLVFTVLTSAMQDDPANRSFFDTNIRFESFTEPLLLLGCFDLESKSFETAPPEPQDPSQLSSTGSFTSFEAEFKSWRPPSDQLSENSFVFSASEVFRFLRDMALDISPSQSTSLLEVANLERKRDQNFYRKQTSKMGSVNSTHLVHPGAILCMIDLLPAVRISKEPIQPKKQDDQEAVSDVQPGVEEETGVAVAEKFPERVAAEVCREEGRTVPYSPSLGRKSKATPLLLPPEKAFRKVNGHEIEPEDIGGLMVSEAEQWCVFLQERVVSEVYSIAISERNQQVLCQVGLPQRIIHKCEAVLANEEHPLHQPLQRTFEKLSYQALTPSDFRSFLRLGNPLCCSLNSIKLEELAPETREEGSVQSDMPAADSQEPGSGDKAEEKLGPSTGASDNDVASEAGELEGTAKSLNAAEKIDEISSEAEPPYGGSLSLARIQSLVSMTTPRDGSQPNLMGQVPPFVEFDLSIDGFGCLFLPSLFPQGLDQGSSTHQAPPTVSSTSGVGGGGDRPFPPNSGLTFSTWVQVTRCVVDEAQKIGLLTITQTFLKPEKQLSHYPCLRIFLRLRDKTLVVTTQLPSERREAFNETFPHDYKDKSEEAVFPCPVLFQLQCWNHIVVVMNKDSVLKDKVLRGKPKVTLFINGRQIGTKKMTSIHLLHPIHYTTFLPFPSETTPYLINAHIGTHVTQRHVSQLVYQMGPTFLFEEQIDSARAVACMYKLGPGYFGSFQAPVVRDQWSTPLAQSEPMSPLVSEDKVLFGLIASCRPIVKTCHDLEKLYNRVDTLTIARELSLSDNDNVTPVALLNNTSSHLYGPSRTLGAIMCGYSGIRSFEPQPLRSLLSSVGGTSVVLGLVAMATTGDSLYASMKALVCIVCNNPSALKEMERTGGFQILGMLLRSKGRMINSNILHLTYTLVGTVNSEYESACIPNPVAFTDLLADLSVWSETSEEVQRSLFNHFFELLTHSSHRQANAEQMLKMNLVSEMLFQLLDVRLTVKTIKVICNVLSALIANGGPRQSDIQRVGQILATTLPSNKLSDENTIFLYEEDSGSPRLEVPPSENTRFGRFYGNEGKQRRAIVLRNILLDVILSLLSNESLEVNSRFAHQLCLALGFDWLMLFMGKSIHNETVIRSLRILVQLLCDPSLQTKFHEGDIFGSWVVGFETISTEMTQLLSNSLTYFNPLKQAVHLPQIPVPGAVLLSQLLPHHAQLSQIYLLMISNLLCRPCSDIPYSAEFNLETLEDLFELSEGDLKAKKKKKKNRMCEDAAHVLLAMSRALLHEESTASNAQNKAVDLIKYFDRLYHNSPDFRVIASDQDFIDSLASVLFPPVSFSDVGKSEGEPGEGAGDSEWIMIEPDQLPGGVTKSDAKEPIILQADNLAVCAVIKLLRTIAIDGFSFTTAPTKDSPPTCPILEKVLNATPSGISLHLMKTYQTRVLQSIMEYLHSGNENVMITFKEGFFSGSMQDAVSGLSVFSARLVDKVWQEFYLRPASTVYTFLLSMVEQARRFPRELPLGDLQRSLNRVILHQVTSIPATELEQKALMDTLCMFSSQAHVIFDDTNVDTEFLECLTYCLLKIAFTDTQQSRQDKRETSSEPDDSPDVWGGSRMPTGYVPGSIAMMKSGANRVWSKMLEYKRKELEFILSVELPATTTKTVSRDPLSSAANVHLYSRLQNCEHFITNNLMKAWENFLSREKSSLISEASQKELRKPARLKSTSFKATKKKKALSVNSEQVVHEYIEVMCPLLVLAAQKYFESLLRKHQRNVEYRSRIAISEWSKIEYELTRERGLWGPENSSLLDKWMLDTVEGPNRMRKRLCKNHRFYDHYSYKPKLVKALKTKYKQPISYDSELHSNREKLFQRPTILATPTQNVTGFHGGEEESPDQRESSTETEEQESTPSLTASPLHTSSVTGRHNAYKAPSSDNPVAQTLYKMLEPDDRITFQYSCARLTGLDSRGGVLLLGTTHFYVIEGVTISNHGDLVDMETAPEGTYHPVVPSHLDNMSTETRSTERGLPIECIKWNYNSIREVHKRRYLLRHCAFEIFNSDGQNHFLIFHSKQRDKIYHKLLSLAKSSLTDKKYVAGIHSEADPEQTASLFAFITGGGKTLPDRWANGEISNFEYLMHLNTLAGRSYNDLMQYPIFPWVLADYSSETLDLSNPEAFRDFSKPMGAQSENRLKRFIERYKYFEDPTGENTPPYYYGTHYSSAMIVASFLIRLEPFTQHFLKLQGGHFDLPDRLFHSIPDAWRSASETNMADIKELIPEFFYLPEFLVNSNRFDLGTKQSGEQLNAVILPPWAKGDPHEFIRLHREALESDYVTAHLHEWIDLIFGYKQTGDESLRAHNVFHHLFYEGAVDIDKIEDPVKRNAAISFIHNFGQTPKQLFKKPHRARKLAQPAVATDSPNISARSLDARRVFYKNVVQLMPSREPVKEVRGEVAQMVCVSDNKIPIVVDRYKLLLPPNYTHYFIWGFPDYSARMASVETDRVTGVFEGLHEGRILCAAAGDDNMVLTGGDSTVVCVWELTSKQKEKSPVQIHLKHTLHGHTASVTCVAASPNYSLIISGSKDQSCILWDMNTFSFVRQLNNHTGSVTLVTINQLNGNIVSCTKNQVRLWTVNGTLLAETSLHNFGTHRITCCAVSELYEWDKENVIITGSTDGVVRVWALEYSSSKESEGNSRKRRSRSKSVEAFKTESEFEEDIVPSPRTRVSTVVEKLRVVAQRERSSSTPSPLNTTVLNAREKGAFPDFDPSHFGDSVNPDSVPPAKIVTYKDPYAHMEASIEDRLDKDDVELLLDLNRDTVLDSASTKSPGMESEHLDSESNDGETESNDDEPDGAPGSPGSDDQSHAGLTQVSNDDPPSDLPSIGGGNGGDIVFTDVEEKPSAESQSAASKDTQDNIGSGARAVEATKSESGAPKGKTTYEELMAEQRKKSEELKKKTGTWYRKLNQVHTLTMHTSFHRKDNDTPAAVTALCISNDHRRLYVGDARGRVFSWTVSDNLGNVMEHWLRDESVDHCMKCNVEFSLGTRKHHCRDCGKIFCKKCSPFECEVRRLNITKKVRVCEECYRNLCTPSPTDF